MERSRVICQYLTGEKHCSEIVANLMLDKLTKYEDIRDEFWRWLGARNYDVESPVVVEGYSAQAIVDVVSELDGAGAFDMLVELRERPREALKILKRKVKDSTKGKAR